jgi:hypothetical protein
MKSIVLLTILLTVGCVLASGCVAQTKKDVNVSVSPTTTFTPFLNATTVPTTTNGPINATNVTNSTKLKGPLRVSVSNFNANLSVFIDNQTVGFVTAAKPLDLSIEEGNHSVKVCLGATCEQDYVVISFAKKSFIDFGDRLKKTVEFPNPTARITDYYRDGDGVSVVVEFINPTSERLYISAEVSVGYSFIAERSGQRVGESARGKTTVSVEPGQRETENVRLYFADGLSYIFDTPQLLEVTIKK